MNPPEPTTTPAAMSPTNSLSRWADKLHRLSSDNEQGHSSSSKRSLLLTRQPSLMGSSHYYSASCRRFLDDVEEGDEHEHGHDALTTTAPNTDDQDVDCVSDVDVDDVDDDDDEGEEEEEEDIEYLLEMKTLELQDLAQQLRGMRVAFLYQQKEREADQSEMKRLEETIARLAHHLHKRQRQHHHDYDDDDDDDRHQKSPSKTGGDDSSSKNHGKEEEDRWIHHDRGDPSTPSAHSSSCSEYAENPIDCYVTSSAETRSTSTTKDASKKGKTSSTNTTRSMHPTLAPTKASSWGPGDDDDDETQCAPPPPPPPPPPDDDDDDDDDMEYFDAEMELERQARIDDSHQRLADETYRMELLECAADRWKTRVDSLTAEHHGMALGISKLKAKIILLKSGRRSSRHLVCLDHRETYSEDVRASIASPRGIPRKKLSRRKSSLTAPRLSKTHELMEILAQCRSRDAADINDEFEA